MHRFRLAVEARDHAAMVAALADDVVFHSPAVHKPYHGKQVVAGLLGAVMRVASDFRYTDEAVADRMTVLVLSARVGDREVEGVDILREDESGFVTDLTVLVRPLSGLQALVAAMQAQLAADKVDR